MRALGFGTYDTAKHPRIGIVLAGLRAHGDTVVEANAPLGFSTAERVAMLGRPWLAYRLALRLARRWLTLARAGRRERRRARPDVVLVGYLGQFDVILARLLFPRERVVLDQMIFAADTARDRGVESGLKLRLLAGLDRLSVRCADLVLLDTDEQIELLPPRSRNKAVVVPVGSPDAFFAAGEPAAPAEAGPLRVAFFGLFTPLQGATVIGAALAELAGDDQVRVTMIGSGQDYARSRDLAAANPHVTWIDWVDAEKLPELIAAHDVCLGIFGTTPKALRVVPNKVFQGAAAGCAIVTSDTAPQRRALGPAAVYVPAGDATALATALRRLGTDPAEVARLRAASRERARAEFSASAIVAPLRARLAAESPNATEPGGPRVTSSPPLPPNARMRWAVVERMVEQLDPRSILEIGCGQGSFGARLAHRGDYLAVEPDTTSYQVARPRIEGNGGQIRNMTSEGLDTERRFELVCAFEVLEHLEDDAGALQAWYEHVAPGGHLLLSVPAWQERFNEWDTLVGHYRRYSPEQIERLLLDAGFQAPSAVVYGWPLGYALEAVRSRIAARKGVGGEDGPAPSMQERTSGSGRILQPKALVGKAMQTGVLPFVALQRLRPGQGTGLVALARRPAQDVM